MFKKISTALILTAVLAATGFVGLNSCFAVQQDHSCCGHGNSPCCGSGSDCCSINIPDEIPSAVSNASDFSQLDLATQAPVALSAAADQLESPSMFLAAPPGLHSKLNESKFCRMFISSKDFA